MDETTVAQWISALGVSSDALSIRAELDDRWCLLSLADLDGSDAIVWEGFWRQQGDRFDWARFTDEQVACYYLLGRLAYGQLVLGELQTRKPAPQPDSPAQP